MTLEVADIAESFVGACGCKAYRQSLVDALGIDETRFDFRPFVVKNGKIQGVSTCGMFAGHCLYLAGFETGNLYPWKIGQPLGAFIFWGKKLGRWVAYKPGLMPSRNDVLLIGDNGGTHICVVSRVIGKTIWTADGGQICTILGENHDGIGRQAVKLVERTWNNGIVSNRNGVKRVVGWISLSS